MQRFKSMSTALSSIYKTKAFVLAKTTVIKLNTIALMINDDLIAKGYRVDVTNPSSWKYYMNLNGQYHQADRDLLKTLSPDNSESMKVLVAGDQGSTYVDFNKELIHGDSADVAIGNEYRYNTQYYNELVTRYPDFEFLILGILSPIDIDIALRVNEGEILYCGGYVKALTDNDQIVLKRLDYGPISENFLIEDNEDNLIPELQENIFKFVGRYLNPNYVQTHNLYYVKLLMELYGLMAMWIYNIRLENIKSPLGHTHSFHIRKYLDGFGYLGWTVDHIGKREALWLYRNAKWLEANSGKRMAFDMIVDNVLTPSEIPIARHTLRHDIEALRLKESKTGKAYMERTMINLNQSGQSITHRPVLEVTEAQRNLAAENKYDVIGRTERIEGESENSMFDNLPTKVLESTVIDLSQLQVVTMEDIALNFWIFTATRKTYRGSLMVTHPISSDRIQLTPLNAYILAIYCLNKGWVDYELEKIPKFKCRLIPRTDEVDIRQNLPKVPTLDDLQWGTDSKRITDHQLMNIVGIFRAQYFHRSSLTFVGEVKRQHDEYLRRYYTYCSYEDILGHSMGEWAAHQMYWHDVDCHHPLEGTSYSDWLVTHGIDLEGFGREDYVRFGLTLISAATGLDSLSLEKLQRKQDATLSILKHFLSYTVHILQSNVSRDSYRIGFAFIRLGNIKTEGASSLAVEVVRVVPDIKLSVTDGPVKLGKLAEDDQWDVKETVDHNLAFDLFSLDIKTKMKQHEHLPLVRTGVLDATIPDIPLDDCFIVEEDDTPIITERRRKNIIVETCGKDDNLSSGLHHSATLLDLGKKD